MALAALATGMFFAGLPCRAQDHRFRHLSAEDGLSSNLCYSVIQDRQGFIWISARNGLCRYDGYNIKVYQTDPADSTSISDNSFSGMKSVAVDLGGNLWVGTCNGLNRYDPFKDNFTRYTYDPDDPVSIGSDWIYCLLADKSGTLWIGTGRQGGLNKYLRKEDRFIRFTNFNNQAADEHIPSIFALFEDQFGILWVGTSDGLYQFDREKEHFTRIEYSPQHPDPGNPILFRYIEEDIDGTLFIGTQFGYLTYNRMKNEPIPFEPLYDERAFTLKNGIIPEPGNDYSMLWMIGDGLYKYDRKTGSIKTIPCNPGIPDNIYGEAIMSFFRDQAGVVWVSSEMGVNILSPDHQRNSSHPEYSEKYAEPNAFMEDEQGHLWTGALSLLHFDPAMNLVDEYFFPENKAGENVNVRISIIFEDEEKNIWVGTQMNGLYLLDTARNELLRCKLSDSDPYTIYTLFQDKRGILWIGTEYGLFKKIKGENPITGFYQDPAWGLLNKTFVICIHEDRRGNLWIGTSFYGLFCQPPDLRGTSAYIQYSHDPLNMNSLSNDFVWSVGEDASGNVWIATENGLNKFIPEEDHFIRYVHESDPGANLIYCLTGDEKGYLWMTTESGLIRFNAGIGNRNEDAGLRYKQILPFKDIYPYRIYKTRNGKLLLGAAFASGKGYYSFHPDSITENHHLPPVRIVDFKVRNETYKPDTSISLKKHLILDHHQNFFSFEFAALDYAQPEKNQYAYKMEGLDESWIYCNNNRLANYTGVPPGNYMFRVKGSNNDGYWNEEGASLQVTILPPPWKSWWACTFYGMALIVLLIGWRRYDLKRQRLKQALEIEKVEADKLKELDSMKSRFFANISHEFRTPLTLILGPLEKLIGTTSDKDCINDLSMMQRNARRLQRLINQLLNLSKLEAGEMKLIAGERNIVSLVRGYVHSFESLARKKNITLKFNSDDERTLIYVDNDKIEKILYNLLSNAFKFTPEGGEISVSVLTHPVGPYYKENTAEGVKIIVADTGPGIPPDKVKFVFNRFYQTDNASLGDQEGTGIGLALAQELVKLHHGDITVTSHEGKGTTFIVTLPKGYEHLKPEEISAGPGSGDTDEEGLEEFAVDDIPVRVEKRTDPEAREASDGKPLVLIVEDNDDLRNYVRSYLDEAYLVYEACDGEEGLLKAIDLVPDLVVSDVMMPKVDGYQLCRALKADERTSHIPVILLTAKAAIEDKLEGLGRGADDFLTKPFDIHELIIRIKNLIRQRSDLKALFRKEMKLELKETVPEMLSMDQQFLHKARKLVEENMADPDFGIESFAKKMALSRVQLHRKLKALLDQPASAFIRTLRLNRAAELLAKKTGSVSEIAYDVGFNTLPYFTKCFREQFGVNPSEYIHLKKEN